MIFLESEPMFCIWSRTNTKAIALLNFTFGNGILGQYPFSISKLRFDLKKALNSCLIMRSQFILTYCFCTQEELLGKIHFRRAKTKRLKPLISVH